MARTFTDPDDIILSANEPQAYATSGNSVQTDGTVGDIVFRTSGVERARIKADGTGTGWPNVLGGSQPVSIITYGADSTGVADSTTAITNAIAAAVALGGGIVFAPAGTYKIASSIAVPDGVSLMGAGFSKTATVTKFKCSAAGAQLAFGAVGTGSHHGVSGNFCVDGNSVATNPLFIGRRVQSTFDPIQVINGAYSSGTNAGVLIQEAQNNIFRQLDIEDCAGPGLIFDLGCGGNVIESIEVNNCGGSGTAQVVFEQSAAAGSGVYTVPTQNMIIGGNIERPTSGATANISHTAGSDNLFDFIESASSLGAGVSFAIVQQALDGSSNTNSRLRFRDCRFQNNTANAGTIFDIGSSCTMVLEGRNVVQTCKYLWKLGATAAVTKLGPFSLLWANVGTADLDPASGGTVEAQVLGSQAQVFTANGTWTVPAGVKFIEVTAVGGGGQGGGGGSGGATQVGGAGGGAAASSTQLIEVVPLTVLTVTIGAGGSAAGAGGAANGNLGANGSGGSPSTVTGSGVSVKGWGGGGGTGSAASSAAAVGGGGWGTAGNTAISTSTINTTPGVGGLASTARGETGGPPQSYSGGGGAGGGAANGTNGGGGGAAGTAITGGAGTTAAGASGTTAGVDGTGAGANTGAGGGGGGGGASTTGKGGNGGAGGSGFVLIKVVG